MSQSASERYNSQLSAYVDGELSPRERREFEQRLEQSAEGRAMVADLRAASGLVRVAMDMEGDAVDWASFTSGVMSKVAKAKLPFWEGLRLRLSELFRYQRRPLLAASLGACAALAIAVPVAVQLGARIPEGYASSRVEVQTVSVVDDAPVRPVITETESGDAVIWLVAEPGADGGKKKKRAGEEGEEDRVLEVREPPRAGEL